MRCKNCRHSDVYHERCILHRQLKASFVRSHTEYTIQPQSWVKCECLIGGCSCTKFKEALT